MKNSPRILILGAGPAGLAASIHLSQQRIHHIVLEKESFPRDKICGDALSGKVVQAVKSFNPDWMNELYTDNRFLGSYGVRFVAPNGTPLDIPFKTDLEHLQHAPGFIVKRLDFDKWLYEKASSEFADFRIGSRVNEVSRSGNQILVNGTHGGDTFSVLADIVIGAEGDRSITAKSLSSIRKENGHYCAGLRAYYSGVSGLNEKGFIELHFLNELLPGYLWIFPMANGGANVGVGMLSSVISKKKIHLRKLMEDILQNHPSLSKRFAHATREGAIKGWGLPLGSKKRSLSGNNFLLTGDAASLIDPFTGEGIGNAIISGALAGQTTAAAVSAQRFDAAFLYEYDKKVYQQLWDELKLSRTMQKLTRYPWLFNFVVNKASKNKLLQETITGMFEDVNLRSRLKKPAFYFELLFK